MSLAQFNFVHALLFAYFLGATTSSGDLIIPATVVPILLPRALFGNLLALVAQNPIAITCMIDDCKSSMFVCDICF